MDSNLSFIFPVKLDNQEREKNIRMILPCYRNWFPNAEIIIVEQTPNKTSWLEHFTKNILQGKYISRFQAQNDPVYKCLLYNTGAKFSTKDIFVFMDVDIIIYPTHLTTLLQNIKDRVWISLGYNGTALYFNQFTKDKIFNEKLSFAHIEQMIDWDNITTFPFRNEYYEIGNLHAVGGCLAIPRSTFYRINGFNPNFKGYGYEDNEIISRAKILEIPLFITSNRRSILLHFPHGDPMIDKSKHEFYDSNHREVSRIEAMNKEQLEEYIKTWII